MRKGISCRPTMLSVILQLPKYSVRVTANLHDRSCLGNESYTCALLPAHNIPSLLVEPKVDSASNFKKVPHVNGTHVNRALTGGKRDNPRCLEIQ